jgi:hypothetical protein
VGVRGGGRARRPVRPGGRLRPRALGRLEPLDVGTARLVGTTSNPWWYAERLAAVPAPYRIVRGDEVREAARAIGERLLTAAAGTGTATGPER